MEVLHQLDSDLTAELIATILLEESGELSHVIMERLGSNLRTQSKDVCGIKEVTGLYYHEDILTEIQSHRQSIYESLPEYYFHPPTLGGLGTPVDEVVEEIKKQKRIEDEARLFFKPFEQEAFYLQILALTQERSFDKKRGNDDMLRLFRQGWPIIQQLPVDCALPFIYVLPLMCRVKGNKEWTQKCISYITALPVAITDSYKAAQVSKHSAGFLLGQSRLSIDTCISGELNDGLCEWQITIGPVPRDRTSQVLPGSGFDELLDYLIECFTPLQVNAYWKIVTQKDGDTFLHENDENGARLGYSFYL